MAAVTLAQRDTGPTPAITTTFVPPPQCTQGHLTMLARQDFYVWLNEPLPIAGTTKGECHPKEFVNSYLDAFKGTTRPAFSPLVCPQSYQTILNQDVGGSPYIVCCPNNYGFAPPAAANPNRPGFGGTCYSNIISTTVTKYNENAYSGLIFFSTSGQAYAHPYDGFAYQGNQGNQGNHQPTVAPTAAAPQPSKTSNVANPAPSQTNTSNDADAASPSDAASPFLQSPIPVSVSTISSSIVAIYTLSSSVVVYSTIQPSVLTIYGSAPTLPPEPSAAASVATTQSSGMSGSAIAGAVIGIIAGVALLAAALFFFLRRRRREQTQEPMQLDGTQIEKPRLEDHPSTRGYASEKLNHYTKQSPVDVHEAPAHDYHELVSPNGAFETYELGTGGRSSFVKDSVSPAR